MKKYLAILAVVAVAAAVGYQTIGTYYFGDEITRATKRCLGPASIFLGDVSEAVTLAVFPGGELRRPNWLFKNHWVSRVRIGKQEPPIYCYIAEYIAQPGREAYALPKEFNQVIKNEKIQITSDKDALEIALKYIKTTGDLEAVIVSAATEIENLKRPGGYFLKDVIKPPVVNSLPDGRAIKLYSWKKMDQRIEAWDLVVHPDGTITLQSQQSF